MFLEHCCQQLFFSFSIFFFFSFNPECKAKSKAGSQSPQLWNISLSPSPCAVLLTTCRASYLHSQPGALGSWFGYMQLKSDCSRVTTQRAKWWSLFLFSPCKCVWYKGCLPSLGDIELTQGRRAMAEPALNAPWAIGFQLKQRRSFWLLQQQHISRSKNSRCLSKEMSWQQPLWHSSSVLQQASGAVATTSSLLPLLSLQSPEGWCFGWLGLFSLLNASETSSWLLQHCCCPVPGLWVAAGHILVPQYLTGSFLGTECFQLETWAARDFPHLSRPFAHWADGTAQHTRMLLCSHLCSVSRLLLILNLE